MVYCTIASRYGLHKIPNNHHHRRVSQCDTHTHTHNGGTTANCPHPKITVVGGVLAFSLSSSSTSSTSVHLRAIFPVVRNDVLTRRCCTLIARQPTIGGGLRMQPNQQAHSRRIPLFAQTRTLPVCLHTPCNASVRWRWAKTHQDEIIYCVFEPSTFIHHNRSIEQSATQMRYRRAHSWIHRTCIHSYCMQYKYINTYTIHTKQS